MLLEQKQIRRMATTTQEEIGVGQTPASVVDVKLEVEDRSESMAVAGEGTDEPLSIKQELLSVVCGASFSTDASLIEHQQTHPNSQDKCSGLSSSHNTLPHTSCEGGPFDIFKCTVCNKAFRTIEDMQQHKQMHNKKNPFSCDLCSEAFKTRSSLLKHDRANHSGEGSNAAGTNSNQKNWHACTYCCKTFKNRSHCVEHERIHTNEKPFDCTKCGKAFNWQGSLRKHMATHDDNRKVYSCKKCGTSFQTYYLLSRHRQLHKDRPHTCSICKKMFAKKNYFQKHLLCHKKEEFICGTCNKRFTTHLKLKEHTESHKTVQNHHSCNTCNKSFKTASHLQKHRQSAHKTNQQHACRFCQGKFKSVTHLNIHLRKHAKDKTRGQPSHSSEAQPSTGVPEHKYCCGICSNSFETYYRMRIHKQMHQERPFMCDICEETCITRADLHQHKQHDCVDSYVSEVCNKTFTSESALQSHKIKQVLEKPYLCGVCLESFKTTSQLKVHVLSHTGKKPYVCKACNKEFTKVIHLQRHQQVCKKKTKCKGSNTIKLSTTDILVTGTAAVTDSPLGNDRPDSDQSPPQTGIQTAKKQHCKQKKYFVCRFCGKNVNSASHLQEHERVHSNERPFSCDDCGKAFKWRNTLKRHRQTHKNADLQKALITKGPYPYSSGRTEHHREQLENPVNRDVMSLNSVETRCNPLSASHLVESFTMFTNVHPTVQINPNQPISYTSSGQFVHSDVATPGNSSNFQNEEQECITIQGFMCEICNRVLDTNSELEMHRRSHDVVELSTSSICRKALDTMNHSTGPGADDLEPTSTDRRVQAIPNDPGTKLSGSDGDAGLPDPSDDMDGKLVEITCTKDLNYDENLSSIIREPEVDCRHGGSQSTTKNDSLSYVQQLFTNASRKLEVVLNKIHFFTCGICNRDFQTSTELDQHKMSHQEGTSDRGHATENPVKTLQQVCAAKLSCRFCGKICSHQARLLEHERIHTKEKPHKCDECGQEFPRGNSLQNHKIRVHKTVFPSRTHKCWKCDTCEKVFCTRSAFDRHAATHSDKRPYKCNCGRCYKHKYHMKVHQATSCREKTSRESLEKTNESDTKAPGPAEERPVGEGLGQQLPMKDFKSSFACHLITHSGVSPHKCDSCSKAFKEKSHLEVHKTTCGEKSSGESLDMLEETSGDVQQSDTTAFGSIEEIQVGEGQLFPTKASSQGSTPKTPPLAHDKKLTTRTVTNQSLVCNICEKAFQTKTSFIIHMDDHRDEHPHKCDICGSAYKRSSQLKAHKDSCKGITEQTSGESPETDNLKYTSEKSQHNATISTEAEDISVGKVQQVPPTKKGCTCRVCGKVCSHRSRLLEHIRTHTKEKPFKCDECDQAFSHKSTLRRHLITCHKREFPDKTGHANNQQLTHQANETAGHADGKVQQVSADGKVQQVPNFKSLSGLKKHFQLPQFEERPFHCHQCDKMYKVTSHLKDHIIQVHTNIREYKCRFCSKGFCKKSDCIRHERTHSTDRTGQNLPTTDGADTRVPRSPNDETSFVNTCKLCREDFPSAAALLKHTTEAHQVERLRNLICEMCDKVYLSVSNLKEHYIQVHTNIRIYKCQLCNKEFCRGNDLIQHEETHKKTKCSLCGKKHMTYVQPSSKSLWGTLNMKSKSGYMRTLKHHKLKKKANNQMNPKESRSIQMNPKESCHMDSKTFQCAICGGSFFKMSCFKVHQEIHKAGVEPIYCKICGKHFKIPKSLHTHQLMFHSGKLSGNKKAVPNKDTMKCEKCGEAFPERSSLFRHLTSVHSKPRPYSCEDCSAAFPTSWRLKAHKQQMHPTGRIKLFVCTVCNKGFHLHYLLRSHSRIHSESQSRELICTICSESFKTEQCLLTHMRFHNAHTKSMCDICGKLFSTFAGLKEHLLCHSDKRDFICERCGKRFKTKKAVMIHRKTKCNEKRIFTCEKCGRSFPRKSFLSIHARSHRDKRRVCSYCNKVFQKQAQLTIHMRIHTNTKPYFCMFCRKTFRTRGVMLSHQNTHTGERPFKCKICGAAFACSGSLYNHNKRVHKKQHTPVKMKAKY